MAALGSGTDKVDVKNGVTCKTTEMREPQPKCMVFGPHDTRPDAASHCAGKNFAACKGGTYHSMKTGYTPHQRALGTDAELPVQENVVDVDWEDQMPTQKNIWEARLPRRNVEMAMFDAVHDNSRSLFLAPTSVSCPSVQCFGRKGGDCTKCCKEKMPKDAGCVNAMKKYQVTVNDLDFLKEWGSEQACAHGCWGSFTSSNTHCLEAGTCRISSPSDRRALAEKPSPTLQSAYINI